MKYRLSNSLTGHLRRRALRSWIHLTFALGLMVAALDGAVLHDDQISLALWIALSVLALTKILEGTP